jgi:hypothetical protein
MPVLHTFVSAKPPVADPTIVGSAEWNAAHAINIVNADVDAAAAIDESKLNLNYPTHALVTLGTTNGLSIVGQVLSLGLASSGVTGALSGADWNTFNGKGDVFGPASAVDNNLAAFNLATGKLIKDSGVLTSDVSSAVSLKHAAVTLDVNADTLLSLSTQALGLDTQTANRVFAGPTTGAAAVPTFRALVAADIPALAYGDISGTGVAGQVAEFVTNTKTLQAAKIIGPATNILTLTNAAAATLALNITAAKTLTLTAADNYTLTVPATGTAALLSALNVFTRAQTIDGTIDEVQLVIDGHSSQTTNLQNWRKSDGTVIAAVQGRGTFYANLGGPVSSFFMGLNATMTGTYNQGIGESSLKAVTSGQFNNAVGWNTLQANTTGGDNNAMGAQALQGNTEGSGNNAMGRTVLLANTTGSNNTGVGTYALTTNVSGGNNVGIGTAALFASTGSDNIAIGVSSSRWLENGANNLAIGSSAGFSNTSGSGNVIIGYKAGFSETLSDRLHIGNIAAGTPLIGGNFLAKTLRLHSDVDIANNGTLGSEKVTNGNFSTNPDVTWTFGAGWTHNVVNFRADRVASAVTTLSQTIGMVAGETYLLTCVIVRTAGKMSIDCGGTSVASGINNSAAHWFTFKATTTGNLIFTPDASFAGYVDTVTVKRIEGGNLIITNSLSGNPYGLPTGDLTWGSDTETNMLFLDSSADTLQLGGTATSLEVVKGGDTFWIGAGSGLPFGSCWGLEIAQTQASAAQNTWYAVNDTDMTDGQLNLVTHDGSGKLTVTYAGKYLVNWSMTLEANANNKHLVGGLGINGTAQSDGQSHIESVTNQELTLAGTAILALTAGQYVQVLFRTTDTGIPNILIDDVNLSLVHIGG